MNLLLLTKVFPYGTDEAFIENEIEFISHYYDEVIIIACEVPTKENKKRELPSNIISYKIGKGTKCGDIMMGMIYLLSNNYVFKTEKINCGKFKQKAFLCYFEGKSRRICSQIKNLHIFDSDFFNTPFALYSYWFFTTARVGMLLLKNISPQIKYSRAHRYDLYSERNCLNYLPYRRSFLEFYDYVFPCSESGANYLKKLFPDYKNKIEKSLLGTLDHGCGLQSTDGIFRIVSCSRMAPVKRVGKIVDIVGQLQKYNKKVIWTHIGDGKEFCNVKILATQRLSIGKFRFLGNLTNKDVMDLYSSEPFDLFLNVSSSEGLPVSIMEAISFGIPVIATDVGGTSEIVNDGKNGFLLHVDFETEDAVKKIIKIIDMQGTMEYQMLRNHCREVWETQFQANYNYNGLHEHMCKL